MEAIDFNGFSLDKATFAPQNRVYRFYNVSRNVVEVLNLDDVGQI
jgi:hypothetical protein